MIQAKKVRRKSTKEFKQKAIRLYESRHKSIAPIEIELGISAGLLNKCRVEHRCNGDQVFSRSSNASGS